MQKKQKLQEEARQAKLKEMFPAIADCAPSETKLNLSTGKAVVHRKVDCWMSFEEYDNITRSFTHSLFMFILPNSNVLCGKCFSRVYYFQYGLIEYRRTYIPTNYQGLINFCLITGT